MKKTLGIISILVLLIGFAGWQVVNPSASPNGLTVTASTGTLTIANGKTLTVSNTMTLAGGDSTSVTFPNAAITLNNDVERAYCIGTVGTSNATEYALTPGNVSNVNCSGTGTPTENPMPFACTATLLTVKAGAAGAVSGSGVIKVYKNGSAQSMTCTLGTGTSCTDNAHPFAMAANDTWKITVLTGQATDTTANVRAAFQCQ